MKKDASDARLVVYVPESMKRCIETLILPLTKRRSVSTWIAGVLSDEIEYLVAQHLARLGVDDEKIAKWEFGKSGLDYAQCALLLNAESLEQADSILTTE